MQSEARIDAALSVGATSEMITVDRIGLNTIVRLIPFDKTPPIDIDDLAFCTVVASQHVKTANSLAKAFAYLGCPGCFFVAQVSDKPGNIQFSRKNGDG
jgi:hypothetical protein